MAQFYSLEEAKQKLGIGEDELKQLVRDGQLREFRDGPAIKYKSEEVDKLAENLETLSGSLGGTSGELILEPSDESSMGLTGSDMLTLEEAERTDADDTTVDEQKDDTVITSVGISVFDDEEVPEAADPGAVTVVADKDKTETDLSVEGLTGTGSGSSGSGLLDLSRESDDTSLGAELLDEIYTEDQAAGLPEMGEATRAGLDAAPEEEPEMAASEPVAEPARAPAATRAPIIVEGEATAVDIGLGGAMVGACLTLALAGVVISASMQGAIPGFVHTMYQNLPIVGGVFAGVTLICFVIGLLVGKKSGR